MSDSNNINHHTFSVDVDGLSDSFFSELLVLVCNSEGSGFTISITTSFRLML